jgi:hypothetical protein
MYSALIKVIERLDQMSADLASLEAEVAAQKQLLVAQQALLDRAIGTVDDLTAKVAARG